MPNKMRECLLSSTVLPSNKNGVPSQVQRVPGMINEPTVVPCWYMVLSCSKVRSFLNNEMCGMMEDNNS